MAMRLRVLSTRVMMGCPTRLAGVGGVQTPSSSASAGGATAGAATGATVVAPGSGPLGRVAIATTHAPTTALTAATAHRPTLPPAIVAARLRQLEKHDDRVFLILGIVVGTNTDRAEGEP